LEELFNKFEELNLIDPITITENTNLSCPRCGHNHFTKNGITTGKQRYKCKRCGKTFSSTSNTSIHYIKNIEKWNDFIYLMLSAPKTLTLKQTANELQITLKTAHSWRYKFLSALNQQDEIRLSGQIELDEVFLPFCAKGRKRKDKVLKELITEKLHTQNKQNTVFLAIHNRNNDFDFIPIKIQQKGQKCYEPL
jgi:transposase-like protein